MDCFILSENASVVQVKCKVNHDEVQISTIDKTQTPHIQFNKVPRE